MKKITLSIATLIYLVVATGIAVQANYCMGRLYSIAYGHKDSGKCRHCGMEKNGCCHSDSKFVKLTGDQQFVKSELTFSPTVIHLNSIQINLTQPLQGKESHSPINIHIPPDRNKTLTYLMDCSFRI